MYIAVKAVHENVVAGASDCRQSHNVNQRFSDRFKGINSYRMRGKRLPLPSIWLHVQTSVLAASFEVI